MILFSSFPNKKTTFGRPETGPESCMNKKNLLKLPN